MKQTLIKIYVLISGIAAISTTILEMQPALFFMDFLAPNLGDRYNIAFVLLVTCFLFLIPLFVFLLIIRLVRNTSTEIIQTGSTGIFVTRKKSFTSAIVGISIFINSKKVGIVDNGKTIFFVIPIGTFTIQAGKGKRASEKMEVTILENNHLKFELYINKDGLFPRIELIPIKD